jgi:hypothetical protein
MPATSYRKYAVNPRMKTKPRQAETLMIVAPQRRRLSSAAAAAIKRNPKAIRDLSHGEELEVLKDEAEGTPASNGRAPIGRTVGQRHEGCHNPAERRQQADCDPPPAYNADGHWSRRHFAQRSLHPVRRTLELSCERPIRSTLVSFIPLFGGTVTPAMSSRPRRNSHDAPGPLTRRLVIKVRHLELNRGARGRTAECRTKVTHAMVRAWHVARSEARLAQSATWVYPRDGERLVPARRAPSTTLHLETKRLLVLRQLEVLTPQTRDGVAERQEHDQREHHEKDEQDVREVRLAERDWLTRAHDAGPSMSAQHRG